MTLRTPYELFVQSEYKQKELLEKGLMFESETKSYHSIGGYIFEKKQNTPAETQWRFAKFEENSDVYQSFLQESEYPF